MTPTLAERLAEVLPCKLVATEQLECDPSLGYCCWSCALRPAVLALIDELIAEERESTNDLWFDHIASAIGMTTANEIEKSVRMERSEWAAIRARKGEAVTR